MVEIRLGVDFDSSVAGWGTARRVLLVPVGSARLTGIVGVV